ncbi:type II restriction endonuclease [Bartonella vinsonii]|uniref:EcoRII C terminal n=1 Tax=Bartonella vinsonii TaxID=33047 RepID=A0A3S4YYJ6_BARVI|nr:type II restriction endonuclease [Bartonella vinsonii]VEJ44901.1 EcoRII C terminal [Bartonella vinsonii]
MTDIGYKSLEDFCGLDEKEKKSFGNFLKKKRSELISPMDKIVSQVVQENKQIIDELLKKEEVSKTIFDMRELSYSVLLKQESAFNSAILMEISHQFEMPKRIITELSLKLFQLNIHDSHKFNEQLINCFGQYAGKIIPYIYALCLSNTQSRRSRAGKTFEDIIYFLYNHFGYSFDAQKEVGKDLFKKAGLGKMVDSVLPSIKCFKKRRDKAIIGTMKTTLRERWQEVIEEQSRSQVPNIHLLTVDDKISVNKIEQMNKHNIVIVVLNTVKNQEKILHNHSVIDFETYFLKELPEMFNYWKNQ